MMMPWGMFGWGAGAFGMVFMLLFWALLIAGVVLVVKWLVEQGRPGGAPAPGGESALEILKKRYARGEIDRDEFEAKKRDLL